MIQKIGNSFLQFSKSFQFSTQLRSKSKKASSNIWLERQRNDPYVKKATKELYRARSAFKLIEIDDKFKFIKPGDVVVDVGAAPGSWTQVAVQRTNSNMTIAEKPQGTVIAVDRDDLQKLDGAHILAFSDITHQKTIEKIEKLLNNRKVNSVISDMAPNSIGQGSFDHDAIIMLQEVAFNFAKSSLVDKGNFLCKIWFGDSTKEFMRALEKYFKYVKLIKPEASRSDSAEVFIFCSDFSSINKL